MTPPIKAKANADKGWAWMVMLSAHCIHLLIGGLERSSGIFYREILSELGATSASAVAFSAIMIANLYLSSPLAGVLCRYWGCRKVMMIGGLLACLGVLLSSFCHTLPLIYLTLGFMTGVGNGLAYTAGLLAVNDYFNRRKATALGIATAGTGVGSFVLPLLTQYLIQVYSYRGCMMILSGILLNLVVCGALLYPLPQEGSREEVRAMSPEHSGKSQGSKGFCAQLWDNIDLKLFLNAHFTVFTAATVLIFAGFRPVTILLPHYAQLKGLDGTTSVLIISVLGICDTVSRFSLGLIFDIPSLIPHRRRIWSLSMLLISVNVAAFAFSQSFASFLTVAVAFGFTSGLYNSQLYCVLGDLLGHARSRTGIALLMLCRGIGIGLSPPLAGVIKDATGSYEISMCIFGGFVFAGFVLLCALEVWMAVRKPRASGQNIELAMTNS